MRHHPIFRSTLGLAIIAGACIAPASLAAADGSMRTTWAYGEDAFYTNISEIQSAPSQMHTPAGAQGPMRTEGMEPEWSYGEGAFYPNIARIQSAPSHGMASAESGAQGPMRMEGMEPGWSYGEGAFYDNINLIQSGRH